MIGLLLGACVFLANLAIGLFLIGVAERRSAWLWNVRRVQWDVPFLPMAFGTIAVACGSGVVVCFAANWLLNWLAGV